nr:bile acid:sodium symporter family protein [Brackiella oedipodis]
MKILATLFSRFTLMLIAVVIIATLLPAQGAAKVATDAFTNIAIALLFFLHGAKLSRQAIIQGAGHWRLHSLVFFSTFVFFPLLGLALRPIVEPLMTKELYLGFMYLCVLPATVQSAIAFTSIARGNIPAAICSASGSSIAGIFITPLLIALVLSDYSDSVPPITLMSVLKIILMLLVPFAAGHFSRPWTLGFISKYPKLVGIVDQGSILLVVYAAFSEAVVEGLWQTTSYQALIAVVVVSCVILALALAFTAISSKLLGFELADRITIVFCGSKKSLANGLPMAKVIFAGHPIGAIVLPLMIFHQIQLMICAWIAEYLKQRQTPPTQ